MKMSENINSPTECVTIVRVTCDEAEPVVLREGVAQLFKLYFDELYNMGCDLGFQGFQSEWEDLPGKYDFKKKGGLFVAVNGPEIKSADQVVGCIALRPLEGNCGEVKRMFIRATSRRNGVGNLLAKAVISHAWVEGYSEIKLDSLERLVSAKFL
jgi:GNAT superfamily N-acetyltransferase